MNSILKFLLDCPDWFGPKAYWGVAQLVRLVPMLLLTALGGLILANACTEAMGRTDAILLGLLCLEAGLLILGISHLALWSFAWVVNEIRRGHAARQARSPAQAHSSAQLLR